MSTLSIFRYDEETINSLLNNQERETLYLDFKSGKALEKRNGVNLSLEISKDVTSFANAAGGSIIYGIKEKNHVPVNIDGTLKIENKKEWLNRVMNGNITPRIEGIEIYPVRISNTLDRAVLVVSIPKSYTVHQAKDKKYYHRYDEESLPMDDHQVRQTMYRGMEPNLRLKINRDKMFKLPIIPHHKQRNLDLTALNVGKTTAKSCWFNIYIPKTLETRHQGQWVLQENPSRIEGMKHFQLYIHARARVSTAQIIIHPGQDYSISGAETSNLICLVLPDSYSKENETFTGYYEIWAENMQPKYGIITFTFKDSQSTISIKPTNNIPILN